MACCGKKNKDAPVNLKLNPPTPVNTKFPDNRQIIYIKNDEKASETVRARSALCSMCVENLNGQCLKTRDEKTGVHSPINKFVNDLDKSCPIGVWGSESQFEHTNKKRPCKLCGRLHNYGSHICKVCVQNLERKRRNLEKGIGSKANLLAMARSKEQLLESVDYTVREDPFTETATKNLHYFVYPRYEESTRHHIDKLKECIHNFNGKRVCCIAVDDETYQDKFIPELRDLFTDVYMIPNNPKKRERAGFIISLDKLQTKDTNEVICFAHAKGQQYHTKSSPIIKEWTDTMYETCVNNWRNVKRFMENGYPAVGSFKNNTAFKNTAFGWHYSGSFWWARSYKLFQRNWRGVCSRWWASESYVGRHFTREEGACLFGEMAPGESLYHHQIWDRLRVDLDNWRKENELS